MRLLTALVGALTLAGSLVSAFSNPVIYEDFADVDLKRYNSTYYLSTSTMQYSPGAPILRSYDLSNWEFIGHSVPELSIYFGNQYTLPPGQNGYNGGVWASWLLFVPQQDKWFWGGCVNFYETHVFTSSNSDPTSSWSQLSTIAGCQYDSGSFQDTDGTVYVSFKNLTDSTIHIAQMSADMTTVEKQSLVFTLPEGKTGMEGTRPYQINGTYYIFSDDSSNGGVNVLVSDSVWGPYTLNVFLTSAQAVPPAPLTGNAGQGALVDTPDGQWFWMGFSWSYPNGRIPVMFPVTWSNGLPVPTLNNNAMASSYPGVLPLHPLAFNWTGVDYFTGTTLGPQWEWNHDPDTTNYTVNNGLTLRTASLTDDWFAARNTLTHRQLGPISTATIKMALSSMVDGDRAGLGLLRDESAYIGVWKSGNTLNVNMVNNITMNTSWVTTSTGNVAASASLASTATTIFLRVISDSTPGSPNATFWYSTDGTTFHQLGPSFACDTDWEFFEGQRFAILNFATKAIGGSVQVSDFELAAGSYTGAAVGAGGTTTTTSSTSTGTSTTKSSTTTTTTKSSTTTTTTKTSTSTTSTVSVPSPTCTASHWSQCGGQGFTGCTHCAAGTTCKASNPYYSQCL